LLSQVVIFELKVSILESFELNIVVNIAYRFEVNSLALLLLTLVDLLTYICYIREHRTSISGVEDQREFVIGEGRLVIGGKGFIVGRREYITVYKESNGSVRVCKGVREFYKGFKEVGNVVKECIKDKGVL
jgi:hypothetical protein